MATLASVKDITMEDVKDHRASVKDTTPHFDILVAVAERALEILQAAAAPPPSAAAPDGGQPSSSSKKRNSGGGGQPSSSSKKRNSGDGGEASSSSKKRNSGNGGEAAAAPPPSAAAKGGQPFSSSKKRSSGDGGEASSASKKRNSGHGGEASSASMKRNSGNGGEASPSSKKRNSGDGGEAFSASKKRNSGDGGEASSSSKKRNSRNGGEASKNRNKKTKRKEKSPPPPPPPLPPEFERAIQDRARGRSVTAPRLVIQKELFATDVKSNNNRLSIPINQIRNEFLTAEEKREVVSKKKFKVEMLTPSLEWEKEVNFNQWDMAKDNGSTSSVYALNGKWNDSVVKKNGLKKGMEVQLWSFRIDHKLCFALVSLR